MTMPLPLSLPLAFLIGGIPFGFLAVRLLLGEDVRDTGSGNIGATNVGRSFKGPWRWVAFAGIYLLDFAKGLVPVFLLAPALPVWSAAAVGLVAVAGHCFSPFLRFKGGKGVATTCGVMAALDWFALVIAIGAFFAVLLVTRVTALGSLVLGFALAAAVVLREPSTAFATRWPVTALALFFALFFVWTHRSNIQRMHAGRQARA
ncbi:MAG: acyl-phosphate glycerol 3-phosphate acyltransferase [Planctomycetes bacterium]|nr:acyl-phosphate glycerol 3-phosphate acyltransferase [Planctomycetota bacterium]